MPTRLGLGRRLLLLFIPSLHRVRESTWEKLQSLQAPGQGPLSKILDDSLKRDPMYPILTREHLEAVDRRHSILIHAIQQCIHQYGRDTVVVSSWG